MVEISALKDAYLVAGLKEDELAQVAALANVRSYNSGQRLMEIGDVAKELFVILSGSVVVTTHDGDRLGEVGANSVIGEMGLVDAMPANAYVTCMGSVCVATFNTADLRKLMSQNKGLGFVILANVARVLSSRLRQTDARIDELCDQAEQPWDHCVG